MANNEGLLSFNGKSWSMYPLPKKTIVRSVEIGKENRIYVGGQDELGYFAPAKNGMLQYYSMVDKLSNDDKFFGDVWDIVSLGEDVYFRSNSKIFKFSNLGAVVTFTATSQWSYLGVSNNQLYAHDNKTGILKFEHEVWMPVAANNILPINQPVTSITDQ